MKRILIALVCSAVAMAGFTACNPAPPANATVLVFGDSLANEARGSGEVARLNLYRMNWGGVIFSSSPCNGIAKLPQLPKRPDVVVIAYSGNNGSITQNCMKGEKGSALAQRYKADVGRLISHFSNGHTRIVIVGAPVRMDRQADTNGVFNAMKSLASSRSVGWYDGGQNISPNRTYKQTAYCNPFEKNCSKPVVRTIRAPDRVHFCPQGGDLFGRCGVYNSGAVRFTEAIKSGIAVSKKPA